MILPFSTQLNGKPTYFVEKIWNGLPLTELSIEDYEYNWYNSAKHSTHLVDWEKYPLVKPKLHTIREDTKDRWKAGNKIDFFINCRQKDMFRFAPVLPVVSVQKVEIIITDNCGLIKRQVFIDDNQFYYEYDDRVIDKGMLQLAQNDGFDTIEDFFTYFDKDFTGKIIHWTDLKY